MKAADLDSREVLQTIEALCIEQGCWALTWDVAARFAHAPEKVVAAKLAKLLKRGLVTGCDCGCRGDWELTTKGREFAGIPEAWRANPMES